MGLRALFRLFTVTVNRDDANPHPARPRLRCQLHGGVLVEWSEVRGELFYNESKPIVKRSSRTMADRASNDADVSIVPSKIPYAGFSRTVSRPPEGFRDA